MSLFVAGRELKLALLLCVLGSATAVAALEFNHVATLLVYLFLGQPMLVVGMVLLWKAAWKEILRPWMSQDRKK
jgi:hypothetical protein